MNLYEQLQSLVAAKDVTANRDNDRGITCFKYSHPKVDWNDPLIRLARGIVVADDGTVVSHPYDKFFNLNQLQAEQEAQREMQHNPDLEMYRPKTLKLSAWQDSPIASITEKIDGSLVTITYREQYGLVVSTSGSVRPESSLVKTITEYIKSIGLDEKLKQHPRWTLICEYYDIHNAIVYNYGDKPRLWLHGVRGNWNGTLENDSLVDYQTMKRVGEMLDIPVVKNYTFDNLQTIQDFLHHCKGEEGVVVTFNNGIKLKLKTDEYMKLHHNLDVVFGGLSKKKLLALAEQYRDEGFDDIRTALNDNPYKDTINYHLASVEQLIDNLHQTVTNYIPSALEMRHNPTLRRQRFVNRDVSELEQITFNKIDDQGHISDEHWLEIEEDYIRNHYREIITEIQANAPRNENRNTTNPHYRKD